MNILWLSVWEIGKTKMRQIVTTPNQVGEILRRRRKFRAMPQRELAAKLGVSQGRMSSIESDPANLTLARLIAAANVLGLELVLQDKDMAASSTEW
jgi:HTH-type transcriptional regulator / antitoxin HipB